MPSAQGAEPLGVAIEQMLPTPTAKRRKGLQSHGRNVVSGALNPAFVCWLMGLPIGWTDCEQSAKESFRQWLRKHGQY
jgi:hypothetical protein